MSIHSRARSRAWLATCAMALGAVCVTPVYAQTFGAPVVKNKQASKVMVANGKLVKKLPVVSQTQAALAAVTEANASGAQVVTLAYGAHKTYTVPIRPGMFTTFTFPADEAIKQFAVSDPGAVQLNVSPDTNTAMLKLTQAITVVATVVTSKHVYYLSIVPAASGDAWYQGVSWATGAPSRFGGSGFTGGLYSAETPAADSLLAGMASGSAAPAGPGLYQGTPNFAYVVSGDAPFRPVAVWDNGRFTWIQFKKNVPVLPAVFVDGVNGLEVVNYTVHADGTQIMVNRLMPHFVLKLGKASIDVKAQR